VLAVEADAGNAVVAAGRAPRPETGNPGDARGQGYPNEWYVVSSKGDPIRK
jgi:hypothetical protein